MQELVQGGGGLPRQLVLLSILYLRCATRRFGAEAATRRRSLSILYLRCALIREFGALLYAPFNSLFEMPKSEGENHAQDIDFQFSI